VSGLDRTARCGDPQGAAAAGRIDTLDEIGEDSAVRHRTQHAPSLAGGTTAPGDLAGSVPQPAPGRERKANLTALLRRRWDGLLIGVGAVSALVGVPVAIAVAVEARIPYGGFWWIPWAAAYAGGVLAIRVRPDSPGARRLLVFGSIGALWNTAGIALMLALAHGVGSAWIQVADPLIVVLDLAMPTALLALLALYPDRRGETVAERALFGGLWAAVVLVPALLVVASSTVEPAVSVDFQPGYTHGLHLANPLHLGAFGFLYGPLHAVHQGALSIVPVLGFGAMLLRMWRASPEERRPMLWPLAGVLVIVLLPVTGAAAAAGLIPRFANEAAEIVALAVVPALATVGIVQPDLFDLPRAIRRSVVYGMAWAVIAAVYLGLAAALGVASGARQVAVVVTIASTLAFQPVWRRMRHDVRRRVYGERVAPDELLRRFGESLAHSLDTGELSATLAETVREGMALRWVRFRVDDRVDVAGELDTESAITVELVHAGATFGSAECGRRTDGRFDAADRELFATVARQAALALHNARLAEQLSERLAEIRAQARELTASRTRIVEAEETARRRIERDIHDGIQQELVALIARIGLARNQLARDTSLVSKTLADLQLEAGGALADLRELAGGIHPSVLSDHGIVGAIEARAARLPLGVTIDCDRTLRATRFAEPIEGAAYYIVSESCTNALKHSGAHQVVVRIAHDAGELRLEVVDDGSGFDTAATPLNGLNGLRDRVEALGGRFAVRSSPGNGTTVTAALPVAAS
jgi:signal transduction histidine kinase